MDHSRPRSFQLQVRVACAGAFGAAWGSIFYLSLVHILHGSWVSAVLFVVGTIVVAFAAWRFIEPFIRRVLGEKAEAHGHLAETRAFRLGLAAVTVTALMMEPIVHGLQDLANWAQAVRDVILVGFITFGWAQAVRTGRGAWLFGLGYGAGAGAIAGVLSAGAVYVLATAADRASINYLFFVFAAIGGCLTGSVWGSFGGAALHLLPRARVWLRLLPGLALAAVVLAVLLHVLVGLLGVDVQVLAVLPKFVFLALGWVFGIIVLVGGPEQLDPGGKNELAPAPVPASKGPP